MNKRTIRNGRSHLNAAIAPMVSSTNANVLKSAIENQIRLCDDIVEFHEWHEITSPPFLSTEVTLSSDWIIIVDAHSALNELLQLFQEQLPRWAKTLAQSNTEWKAAILFVSDQAPHWVSESIRNVHSAAGHSVDPIIRMHLNRFIFEMTWSYKWGRFCGADRVREFLIRVARNNDILTLNAKEIFAWEDDIDRLWTLFRLKAEDGLWMDVVRPATPHFKKLRHTFNALKDVNEDFAASTARTAWEGTSRQSFLRHLALVFQLGLNEQQAAEDAIVGSIKTGFGDPNERGIEWLKETPGLLKLRDKLNRLTMFARELRNIKVFGNAHSRNLDRLKTDG